MAPGGKEFVIATVTSFVLTQSVAWISGSQVVMSKLALAAIFVQWTIFIHASGILGNQPTERFYDLTGSCTYVTLTFLTVHWRGFANMSTRQRLVSFCVLLWAGRLGSFLFSRISRDGGIDSRFTQVKKNVLRFWTFWTIQGVWVYLTACPVYLLNSSEDKGPEDLTVIDILGLFIWIFGLSFETIADIQKTIFKADQRNKGQFICTGLWAISRHPNYFGEITLWIGIFITCSVGFTKLEQWVTILSPLFVSFLLVNVSGIPLLEKAGDKHWGDNPEYKAYKERVPVLIPFVGRRGNAPF